MNEHEFTQKVMVFSSKFFSYSYRILGNREEALDTVQDLYVKLWSIRFSLKNINIIEAFATTVIRNICIDRLKKLKSSSLHSEYYSRLSLGDESNVYESINNEAEIKVDIIRRAINKLPRLQQRVFLMREFEEREYEDIANELNLTSENVRVMLSRARKRVRELVGRKN
jgi:RNA polymerase sigma-70 factor (ECF subfamily)